MTVRSAFKNEMLKFNSFEANYFETKILGKYFGISIESLTMVPMYLQTMKTLKDNNDYYPVMLLVFLIQVKRCFM